MLFIIIKIINIIKKLYFYKINNVLMINEFVRYCLYLSGYIIRMNWRKNRNIILVDELIIVIYRINNVMNNMFFLKNLLLLYILINNDIIIIVRFVIVRL